MNYILHPVIPSLSETDAADEPPPFEDSFASDDVEQRIYGTILQIREPATASAIADIADCDPKTARKYLGWFDDLGIVTRHDSHPATYERNDAYFEWRRINQLTADHSVEDLQDRVRELTTRITDYEGDPLGERSHVLPWSLVTLNSAADVEHYLTSLVDERTEDVASQLIDYISS